MGCVRIGGANALRTVLLCAVIIVAIYETVFFLKIITTTIRKWKKQRQMRKDQKFDLTYMGRDLFMEELVTSIRDIHQKRDDADDRMSSDLEWPELEAFDAALLHVSTCKRIQAKLEAISHVLRKTYLFTTDETVRLKSRYTTLLEERKGAVFVRL